MTLDNRWKVFRSIHPWPSTLGSIRQEAGIPNVALINTLDTLQTDGLIEIVGFAPLAWRLNDGASS
jgi:hypothetical protein